MNLTKLAPWNWFKKEEEAGTTLPVHRVNGGHPAAYPLARIHQEMDRLFEDFFRGFDLTLPDWGGRLASVGGETWLKPSVDISATDKEYTIQVELPGITPEDVHVELAGDTLKISGEKKQEKEDKNKEYYRIERSYGAFQRVLSLPEDADREHIEASFKDGVMTIQLPRTGKAATETKQIEIKTNGK